MDSSNNTVSVPEARLISGSNHSILLFTIPKVVQADLVQGDVVFCIKTDDEDSILSSIKDDFLQLFISISFNAKDFYPRVVGMMQSKLNITDQQAIHDAIYNLISDVYQQFKGEILIDDGLIKQLCILNLCIGYPLILFDEITLDGEKNEYYFNLVLAACNDVVSHYRSLTSSNSSDSQYLADIRANILTSLFLSLELIRLDPSQPIPANDFFAVFKLADQSLVNADQEQLCKQHRQLTLFFNSPLASAFKEPSIQIPNVNTQFSHSIASESNLLGVFIDRLETHLSSRFGVTVSTNFSLNPGC